MAHWIIDTAGVGSLIVLLVAGSVLIAYVLMARWIVQAPRDDAGKAEFIRPHADRGESREGVRSS
jgi:hypothetical protein